jgi:RHS repeat-associated protein
MTDATGSLLEQTRYVPYGGQRGEGNGITATAYKFTDQELDKKSGFYNYDARLYDPVIGRFVSADSVIPNWYDPQALNRYSYSLNNPVKYVDPDGHSFVLAVLVGAGLAYLTDAYLTPDIANTPVDVSAPLGDTSTLEHAGSLFTGASVGVTAVTSGLKAAAQEAFDEAVDNVTGGASSLTKVGTGPGWYCDASKRTVLGKWDPSTKNIKGIQPGENSLLKHLPDQGSPKLNWKQNSIVLRTEMNKGLPLRDAHVDSAGKLLPGSPDGVSKFIDAERNLLRNHGWTYDPKTTLWSPPAGN